MLGTGHFACRPARRQCRRRHSCSHRSAGRSRAGKTGGATAVVTFVDVTQLKQAEQLAQDAKRYAENIVHAVREPLLVLDAGLRVQVANKSFYKTFQVSENQTENQVIYDLGNRHWDIPELRKLLSELLPQHKTLEDFAVEREFPGIGRK